MTRWTFVKSLVSGGASWPTSNPSMSKNQTKMENKINYTLESRIERLPSEWFSSQAHQNKTHCWSLSGTDYSTRKQKRVLLLKSFALTEADISSGCLTGLNCQSQLISSHANNLLLGAGMTSAERWMWPILATSLPSLWKRCFHIDKNKDTVSQKQRWY